MTSTCEAQARVGRRFFRRDPVALAHALLGRDLVRVLEDGTRMAGRIVEVEAYLGTADRAAHSHGGRHTPRNHSMYLDGGHAYVYFTYGMHWCMNVVADHADEPTACLIRALEPREGVARMRQHRCGKITAKRLRDVDLCSGPAKLAQALAIDRDLDGEDLVTSRRLYIARRRSLGGASIVSAPRVGIGYAREWVDKPLRFYLEGNPHVSVR